MEFSIIPSSSPVRVESSVISTGTGVAHNLKIRGNYAYVCASTAGLHIIDISDPVNPFILTTLILPNSAMGVYIQEDYCYVNYYYYNSPRWGELFIINIANPGNPVLVGQYQTANNPRSIAVQGNYAYLALGDLGLQILDISNRNDPESVLIYNTSGYARDIKFVSDYIFLVNQNSFMILRFDPQTGIVEEIDRIPQSFALAPNYPNPFNAQTTIRHELPVESDVRLEIYDILGRKVETLVNGLQPAGAYSVIWDADNASSGLYFYKILTGDYSQKSKMVLLK